MNRFGRTSTPVFVLFIVLSHHIFLAFGDGSQSSDRTEEKPSLAKALTDAIALLKSSHQSSWEKIKAIILDLQLQFSPPNLDFRDGSEGNDDDGGGGTGAKMREAAEKSFESSKATVEESAKSAAEVVREVTQKTAEKVKGTVSDKDDSHDEL